MLVILTGLELVVLSQSSQVWDEAGSLLVLVTFTGVEVVELYQSPQ